MKQSVKLLETMSQPGRTKMTHRYRQAQPYALASYDGQFIDGQSVLSGTFRSVRDLRITSETELPSKVGAKCVQS